MTKQKTILIVVAVGLVAVAVFAYKNYPALAPAVLPPVGDIVQDIRDENEKPAENETDFPLTLPDGFKIEVLADKLPNARVIIKDDFGNYWVSQPSLGQVSQIEMNEDGTVAGVHAIFRGLRKPHGLALDPNNRNTLYIAEEHALTATPLYSDGGMAHLADLPTGGGHSSRTIQFGPDGRLYVAIGSSCNVCIEKDPLRAAIYTWTEKDGLRPYAKGLRNTVFFTWDDNGKLWGNDMGRDLLGDDLPPDELNVIESGKDYGWPICYGKNVHDTQFDKNGAADACADMAGSTFDYPAHSAPLGIAFVPKSWPAKYRGGMIIAFHGSWNRSVPTGYKLAFVKRNLLGQVTGIEDFVSGWLKDGAALGRPVDVVAIGDDLFVTDDKAGVVYKISYIGK